MARARSAGFTFIELLVVFLIIAVISLMALPQFRKSAETTRADETVSTLQILGTTSRIYFLDKNMYAGCAPGGTCGSPSPTASRPLNACPMTGVCDCNYKGGANPSYNCGDPCTLMWCGYMAPQDLGNAPYEYHALDAGVSQDPCGLNAAGSGAPVGNYVACAKRCVTGGGAGSDCVSAGSTYAGWGYTVDANGDMRQWPAVNGPPPPPSS